MKTHYNFIIKKISSLLMLSGVRVFLFFVVAAFIIHIDRFLLGDYALFKIHDTFELNWPVQFALAQRVLSFQIPGWFPDYVGGVPFFYMDINWLFFPMLLSGFLVGPWNFTAITIMQFVLAGFGAYLFLQYFFDSPKATNIFGGFLYALGTFNLTYWRIFDLAVIPLLLYCTNKIAFCQNKKEKLLLLFGLLLSITNIQFARGALFIAFFHLVFVFFTNEEWEKRRKVLFPFVLVWLFVAIINLPLIFSLLTSTAVGSRGLVRWVPESPLSVVDYLRNLMASVIGPPAMSFGFVGTLLLFYSLIRFKQWPKLVKYLFYFYLAVLFYVIFIDRAIWFQTIRQHLPLKDFRLVRFILPAPFIFWVICASAFNDFLEFIKKQSAKAFFLSIQVAVVLVIYHLVKYTFPQSYIEIFTVLLSAGGGIIGIALINKFKLKQTALVSFIIGLLIIERFINMSLVRMADFQPPSFKHFFQSELFNEFRPTHKFDYRIAFINWHPTAGVYNGYQVAGGYISQYMKRYALFWASVIPGEKDDFLSYIYRPYLLDKSVERESRPPGVIRQPTFRTDLLALNNVRYVFSLNEIERPQRWGLVLAHTGKAFDRALGWHRYPQTVMRMFNSIDYYVYEIKNWLPRVYLAKGFVLAKDEINLKHYLDKKQLSYLMGNVIYNRQDPYPFWVPKVAGNDKESEPRIIYYSDNKIIVDAWARKPQQLVLVENYSDEWKASVNGQPAQIYPAYGVFRSVLVGEGRNCIVFEYKPAYLIPSFWVSGVGVILFIAIGCFWAFRGTKESA